MSDLRELIDEAIRLKTGDRDFGLWFSPDPDDTADCWEAQIGNPNQHVRLGEVDGEYAGCGRSPEEAVTRLIAALQTKAPAGDEK